MHSKQADQLLGVEVAEPGLEDGEPALQLRGPRFGQLGPVLEFAAEVRRGYASAPVSPVLKEVAGVP
jgi:hypothetical protein